MKLLNLKLIAGLMLLVALARLAPHPWNVTPMGALALFAGACLPRRIAWLVPAGASLSVDLLIGIYHPGLMLFVYAGYAASALIGGILLRHRRSMHRLGIAILAGASVFYLVSNLGAWLTYYPLTLEGLIACYVRALPFFGRSLLGDSVYAVILFGLFEAARGLYTGSAVRHAYKK